MEMENQFNLNISVQLMLYLFGGCCRLLLLIILIPLLQLLEVYNQKKNQQLSPLPLLNHSHSNSNSHSLLLNSCQGASRTYIGELWVDSGASSKIAVTKSSPTLFGDDSIALSKSDFQNLFAGISAFLSLSLYLSLSSLLSSLSSLPFYIPLDACLNTQIKTPPYHFSGVYFEYFTKLFLWITLFCM